MRFSSAVRVFASLSLVPFAVPAFAADLPDRSVTPTFVEPATSGYTVIIGIGPDVANQFPGSKSVTVYPSVHLSYRKVGEVDPFYTPDDAFDLSIYENSYFRVGPAANFTESRGLSGGNGNFVGLPNVGNTLQLGGFVEVNPVPNHLRLRGEILQGVTGSKSLVGNIHADAYTKFGPFEVSIGPRLAFGDDRFASDYFSVSQFASTVNGRIGPYNASGGLTEVGGLATVRYDISPRYSLLAFGGANELVGSVGDSPIPNVLGSKIQFTAGATLNYTFNFKGFGVFGY